MLGAKTAWKGLDDEFARIERELTATARGVTVSLWKDILKRTPQWSGAMAGSWTYSIGVAQIVDRSAQFPLKWQPGETTPFRKGDAEAILVANQASAGAEMKFRLGDRVVLANGAYSSELGHYAARVEDGSIALRGANMPGMPAKLALANIEARYASGIKKASAGQLKNLRIL